MAQSEIQEILQDLQDEVKDCEGTLKADNDVLRDATKWVDASLVRYAEAIIALHQFKQQHGI